MDEEVTAQTDEVTQEIAAEGGTGGLKPFVFSPLLVSAPQHVRPAFLFPLLPLFLEQPQSTPTATTTERIGAYE